MLLTVSAQTVTRVDDHVTVSLPYIAGMRVRPSLDQRTSRAATSIKMPAPLKQQIEDYADQLGIPINSAMIVLLDRSLQAAGYPGVSGSLPNVGATDVA